MVEFDVVVLLIGGIVDSETHPQMNPPHHPETVGVADQKSVVKLPRLLLSALVFTFNIFMVVVVTWPHQACNWLAEIGDAQVHRRREARVKVGDEVKTLEMGM